MKFTINSRVLKSALESTAKAINPKPTIPSLANFLLEGNGNYLTITGSDGNTTIRETIPCEVDGSALLLTNILELVRAIPDEDITISTEGATCKVEWKNGHSTLPALNPEDFPEIQDTPDNGYISVKSEELASALLHTLPHTGEDSIRPVMSGVFFNAKADGTIDVVASDSHTLGVYTIKTGNTEPFNFIVPATAIRLVGNAAKSGDVQFADDENSIFFRTGFTTIITRKIVGKFPNYAAVIPQTFTCELSAQKSALLDTLKRVSVCANKASGHLKLSLGILKSSIEAQDLSYNVSATETPEDVRYDGSDLVIGFKDEYLIKCIAAIQSDEIKIKFTDARKAAVVTSDTDKSIMLVMPLAV